MLESILFSVLLFPRKSWNYPALRRSLIPNTSRASQNPKPRLGGVERENVGRARCQVEVLRPACCAPPSEPLNHSYHSYPWPPLLENGESQGSSRWVGPVIPNTAPGARAIALWSLFSRSCRSAEWPQRKTAGGTSPGALKGCPGS